MNINDNFPNSASVRFGTDSAMTLYRVLCLVMRPASISVIVALCCLCTFDVAADIATGAARARELGVPFDGIAGQFNAITDVRGVEVGHTTIVEGGGKLVVGKGPVRTGVTAILPLGKSHGDTPVPAAVYSFNGNGEMTGSAWVEESGFLEGPVLLTNTHSVGVVRVLIAWTVIVFSARSMSFQSNTAISRVRKQDRRNDRARSPSLCSALAASSCLT